MEPGLAHANLAPPRPSVFARGLVPALLAHVLLGVALAQGVNWKRTPDPERIVNVPGVNMPGDRATLAADTRSSAPAAAESRPAPAEPVIQPGLASVRSASPVPREPATAAAPVSPAPVTSRPAPPEPTPGRTAMGASAAPPATEGVRPSFDCTKARSPAERAICADPQLAQLDRDLGRLHARAKAVAPDAAAFRRQNEFEWKRRETACRGDGACLRDWYANRREQLEAVLGNTTAGR